MYATHPILRPTFAEPSRFVPHSRQIQQGYDKKEGIHIYTCGMEGEDAQEDTKPEAQWAHKVFIVIRWLVRRWSPLALGTDTAGVIVISCTCSAHGRAGRWAMAHIAVLSD